MADVAGEIAKLGLDLPTDVGASGPLAELWKASLDESPPDPLSNPPPSLITQIDQGDQIEWRVSESVDLIPGVEARVFFLTT